MNRIENIFDLMINEITQEVNVLGANRKLFDDLKYTQYEFFESLEFKQVFMVSNQISLINNIEAFNNFSNDDEKDTYLLHQDYPTWNNEYIKEAINDAYVEILWRVINKLKLKKAEVCSKFEYYGQNEFTDFVKAMLDSSHQNILNYYGQQYINEGATSRCQKLFNNKLDVIYEITMRLTNDIFDGGGSSPGDNVYCDYCYPGIYIDREEWENFEFSYRIIEALKEIISIPKSKKPLQTKLLDLNQKVLLMDRLSILDFLENNGVKSNVKMAKILSLLLTSSFKNTKTALEKQAKNPNKLGDKYHKDRIEVDDILNDLE
jgi:hypothetical protein